MSRAASNGTRCYSVSRLRFLPITSKFSIQTAHLAVPPRMGAHGHPSLMSPDLAISGTSLLSFFHVDDFDMELQRARSLVARFEEEPHVNPNTQTNEFSLRDPDRYYVTISGACRARMDA